MKITIDLNEAVTRRLNIEAYVLWKIIESSQDGFNAPRRVLAAHLGISERQVFRIIRRLINEKLLVNKDGVLFSTTQLSDVSGSREEKEVKNAQSQDGIPKTKPRGFVYPAEFEEIWKLHNIGDKWAAYKAYWRRKKEGYTDDDLKKAIEVEQSSKSDRRFYKHLSTLLNSDIDILIEQSENEQAEADDDIWLDDLKMTFREAKARGLL